MCVCQRVRRGRRQKEEVGEKRRRLGGRKEGQDRYKERAFLFRCVGEDVIALTQQTLTVS